MTVRHAGARQEAKALAAKLHTMSEAQVREFVQELPSVAGVLMTRDVYFFGDLVLKLAPDPDQPKPCTCFQPVTCPCTIPWCGGIHEGDEQECLCFLKERSPSYSKGQNEAEAALWRKLSKDVRRWFAEVYASSGDGFWLIQEKVTPMMGWATVPDELKAVAKRVGIGDLTQSNCGNRSLEDGNWQPVILDYGISRLWQKMTGETHLDLIDESKWRTIHLPDA